MSPSEFVDLADAHAVGAALDEELERLGMTERLTATPRPVPTATATWVYEIDTTDGPRALRVFRDDLMDAARREHELARFLTAHDYPGPFSFALADAFGPLGHPFVIQEWIDGRSAARAMAGPRVLRIADELA